MLREIRTDRCDEYITHWISELSRQGVGASLSDRCHLGASSYCRSEARGGAPCAGIGRVGDRKILIDHKEEEYWLRYNEVVLIPLSSEDGISMWTQSELVAFGGCFLVVLQNQLNTEALDFRLQVACDCIEQPTSPELRRRGARVNAHVGDR